MGRPIKIKNYSQIRIAGARLKSYRTAENITQEALAEMLDVDVSSVKRYEAGKECLISQKAAERLAHKTNTSRLYWLGYSISDVEYDEIFGDELESAEYIPSSVDIQKQQETANIKAAFSVFDADHHYEYRNIEDTAEYEFDGVPDPYGYPTEKKYSGPHLIVSTSNPSAWVSFAELPRDFTGWYSLITSIGQKHST